MSKVDTTAAAPAFDPGKARTVVTLARETIQKYGANSDKPSVHLAREVIRLSAVAEAAQYVSNKRTASFGVLLRFDARHWRPGCAKPAPGYVEKLEVGR